MNLVNLPVIMCKIKQGCISFPFFRSSLYSLFLYLFMVFQFGLNLSNFVTCLFEFGSTYIGSPSLF